MSSIADKLRNDAERIWRAAVAGVLPERLVPEFVHVDGEWLLVGDDAIDLRTIDRIVVVGAGKAAGAMAIALEAALGPRLLDKKHVSGWVNVPAGGELPMGKIHLHVARPAGVNEPTAAGVQGTLKILEIVSALGSADLCICLLTGGGSALLPAPYPAISLEDKLLVTRMLSAAGADIEQLNTVRQHLSRVKGGGLARACGAGRLVTLVISDVLGDRADIIASGPTVESASTARDALAVLETLGLVGVAELERVVAFLKGDVVRRAEPQTKGTRGRGAVARKEIYCVMGNNATAVDAAGVEAERLGYSHAMLAATRAEGTAEDVGRHLAAMAVQMRDQDGPNCLITGGEPTVTLVDERTRGKGGRNQQLALAALEELGDCERICLLSGGTDGEDGPTDAAGAVVTSEVVRQARAAGFDPAAFLKRNDAYNFFGPAGGLFITGPTRTNVCDVRVVVVERRAK